MNLLPGSSWNIYANGKLVGTAEMKNLPAPTPDGSMSLLEYINAFVPFLLKKMMFEDATDTVIELAPHDQRRLFELMLADL
jgi:hypothetical protein